MLGMASSTATRDNYSYDFPPNPNMQQRIPYLRLLGDVLISFMHRLVKVVIGYADRFVHRFAQFCRNFIFLESQELHNLYSVLNGVPRSSSTQDSFFQWDVHSYHPLRMPTKKYTLVLDLDETLIHTTREPTTIFDLKVDVTIDQSCYTVYVRKRPFLDVFLATMSRYYELVIFTAGVRRYADAVVDAVDRRRVVKRRYFRNDCVVVTKDGRECIMKELSGICRNLSKAIMIDNTPDAYACNKENAIPISTWYSDQNDEALLNLMPFLISLQNVPDVRTVLSRRLDC